MSKELKHTQQDAADRGGCEGQGVEYGGFPYVGVAGQGDDLVGGMLFMDDQSGDRHS